MEETCCTYIYTKEAYNEIILSASPPGTLPFSNNLIYDVGTEKCFQFFFIIQIKDSLNLMMLCILFQSLN